MFIQFLKKNLVVIAKMFLYVPYIAANESGKYWLGITSGSFLLSFFVYFPVISNGLGGIRPVLFLIMSFTSCGIEGMYSRHRLKCSLLKHFSLKNEILLLKMKKLKVKHRNMEVIVQRVIYTFYRVLQNIWEDWMTKTVLFSSLICRQKGISHSASAIISLVQKFQSSNFVFQPLWW